ncbi:MAG: hypothetical protein M0032_04745 [Actinomycetota bacterium]|nr:hypothetical protein [Actinomycetota bacterium]
MRVRLSHCSAVSRRRPFGLFVAGQPDGQAARFGIHPQATGSAGGRSIRMGDHPLRAPSG